jgi:Mrp family chromosome partitioning ATPase
VLGGAYGQDEPDPRAVPSWTTLLRARVAVRALDPRLTARLRAERDWDRILSARLRPGRSIAVVGLAPGSGRTTTAALLSVALARYQGRRVLAIDASDSDGLHRRLAVHTGTALHAVLVGLGVRGTDPAVPQPGAVGQRWLRRALAGAEDVLLLARDPAVAEPALSPDEYPAVARALGRYVSVMVTDTPPLSGRSVVPAVVATADRVVVVAPDDEQAAEWVQRCLPWLGSVLRDPLPDAVAGLVVRRSRRRSGGTPTGLDVPVSALPYDPALSSGLSGLRWRGLSPRTRESVLALAARLVGGLAADAPD